MKFFAGSSSPKLASSIAHELRTMQGGAELIQFTDGEISVKIIDHVRRRDVYVLQTFNEPVNDKIMELLIMIDAFRRSSPRSITAIIPYLAYSRKEKKDTRHDPISGKLIANLLQQAGITGLITTDLHADAIEGFFDVPVINLSASTLFSDHLRPKLDISNTVVVAPDMGGAKRARKFARELEVPVVILEKVRPHNSPDSEIVTMIGDVEGKHAIIIDDIVSTGGTLVNAAKLIKERGAKQVDVCITHALLCGSAVDKIQNSVIQTMYITDSVPVPSAKMLDKFEILSIDKMIACEINELQAE